MSWYESPGMRKETGKRKQMIRSFALILLHSVTFGTLVGCSDNDFPKYYELGGLRVIALTTDDPEVLAGSAPITVTPFVSDVEGRGQDLVFSAEVCVQASIDFGGEPTCDGNPSQISIATDDAVPAGLLNQANLYTASLNPITVPIPTSSDLESFDASFKFNGVPLLVLFHIRRDSGEEVKSFRRIYVTTDSAKTLNSNPEIDDVLINNDSLGADMPAREATVRVTHPSSGSGGPEEYEELNVSGARSSARESLAVTWFVSKGEIDFSRINSSSSSKFTPPDEGPLVLVAVLRDGRGGLSLRSQVMQ